MLSHIFCIFFSAISLSTISQRHFPSNCGLHSSSVCCSFFHLFCWCLCKGKNTQHSHKLISWQVKTNFNRIHHLILQELVLEKETRIRETMKIMGLSNWVLWTTWFLKQLLFYLLPIICMTVLLKVRQ